MGQTIRVRDILILLMGLTVLSSQPLLAAEDKAEPGYSKAGADTCLRCHDESSEFPVVGIFRTKHAIASDERSPFGQLQCESCHGPGKAHTGRVRRGKERPDMLNFGSEANTPVPEQNAMCEGCHQSQIGANWHGGMHESADLSCADCHSVHTEKDPVFDTAMQPQVCFECHRSQKTDSLRFSSHPIRFGKMACTDCHNPHGTVAESDLRRDTLNDTCYECHTEKRGPFLWEHAPVSEDCSLCHEVHGSNHPSLLTRRAPLLCQQCHSQAGHPSIAHTSSGLPSQGQSSYLGVNSCANCHSQVHGSNHPSGGRLTR